MRRTARVLTAVAVAAGCTLAVPVAYATDAAIVRSYVPGDKSDPQLRTARFEIDVKQYLDASVSLRELVDRAPEASKSAQLQRLLADANLGFGLPAPAEQVYRELSPVDRNSQPLGEAQLELATQLYNHGDTQQAVDLLNAVDKTLPRKLKKSADDLMGRALLRLDHVDAATEYLRKASAGNDNAYARYNLAVTLLRTGHTQDGLKQIAFAGCIHVREPDAVDLGSVFYLQPDCIPVHDSDGLALRDHANVVLGYYYLRHKETLKAINAFYRVRVRGPYSNRALLGLGWAYLALPRHVDVPAMSKPDVASADILLDRIYAGQAGVLIRPGFVSNTLMHNSRAELLRHLPENAPAGDRSYRLRRALVPWSELLSRDPMDAAVQEGMIAVPYALNQAGAHQQALEYYQKAVAALEKTRTRIAAARREVASGRMVRTMIADKPDAQSGWNWRLLDLPNAVETFYLQNTIADHPFQETLKNYRDLVLLRSTLIQTSKQLAASISTAPQGAHNRIPAQYLVSAAQERGAPPPSVGHGAPIRLELSSHLDATKPAEAAVELTSHGAGATSGEGVHLALAAPPPQGFHGAPQTVEALQLKIAGLYPRIQTAMDASSRRLQQIALAALDAQDATAEKYLVQVHFAVARIYDSQADASGGTP